MEYEHTNLDGKMGVSESRNKVWVFDETLFWVNEVENKKDIGSNWFKVKNVSIGKPRCDEPDNYYLVTKNHEPYLMVSLYYDYKPYEPAYTLWHNYLFIKRFKDFYYIDLLTFEQNVFPPKEDRHGFIQEFYQLANRLLVASMSQLFCFDNKCALLWQTKGIACDLVSVSRYEDRYLIVRGNDDPPWGWIKCKVELATGNIIESEPDYCDEYWRSSTGWDYEGVSKRIANGDEAQIKALHTCPTELMRDLYPAILKGTLKSKHKGAIALCEKICSEQNIKIDRRIYK